MGKRTPAPPAPPDPVVTSRAQAEMNADTARLSSRMNRVNQSTPFGSLTYNDLGARWAEDYTRQMQDRFNRGEYTPGANNGQFVWADEFNSALRSDANPNRDRWEVVQTLSPAEQRQLDMSNQAQDIYGRAALGQLGRVEDVLSRPMDISGLPQLQSRPDFTGIGDPNQSREAVEQALFQRLNPLLERDRAALESRLASQGITMGSEAWNRGMDDFNRQSNDARLGAILNAGQEQSRVFGLGFNQAQFGNQARTQGLNEMTALRQMPLNEAAALLSGSAVQMPQFVNTPGVNVAPTDYQGAVDRQYQGQLGAWQQRAADVRSQNAMAAQLGGIALGAGLTYGLPALSGLGIFGTGSVTPTIEQMARPGFFMNF